MFGTTCSKHGCKIDRYIAILSSTNRSSWLSSARKFRTSSAKMTTLCFSMWLFGTLIVMPIAIRAKKDKNACRVAYEEEVADPCEPEIDEARRLHFNLSATQCQQALTDFLLDAFSQDISEEIISCKLNSCNGRGASTKFVIVSSKCVGVGIKVTY